MVSMATRALFPDGEVLSITEPLLDDMKSCKEGSDPILCLTMRSDRGEEDCSLCLVQYLGGKYMIRDAGVSCTR